jgi:hypothetical protein
VNDDPTIHDIARVVILYRRRNIRPADWDTVGDAYHRAILTLVRVQHRALLVALTIGRDAHTFNRSMPVLPAAAIAYVVTDAGNPSDVARRFLMPGSYREAIEDGDPRTALQQAVKGLPPDAPVYRTMGLAMRAWGFWVTGSNLRQLNWPPDAPVPRVEGWPAMRVPGLRPQ